VHEEQATNLTYFVSAFKSRTSNKLEQRLKSQHAIMSPLL